MQNEQVDKVSTRMVTKITPILNDMAKDQNLTRESIAKYSQRISDQVGTALTAEMSRNQKLNNNIQQTQEVANDALKLNHELTALYLSTLEDQGILTRILSLPADVVKDAANMSIVSSSNKKKITDDLITKENEIEKRLSDIQAQAPKS
jgi:hypothetical protein